MSYAINEEIENTHWRVSCEEWTGADSDYCECHWKKGEQALIYASIPQGKLMRR
jgi:hypothetical protein